VPRKVTRDRELPRRRRGAVAAEAEAEHGFVVRMLLHSPKDMVAGLLAFAATSGIIANALFLQTGPHPAPMFGSVVVMPQASLTSASPLPRPRPVEADALVTDSRLGEAKITEQRLVDPRPIEPRSIEVKAAESRAGEPRSVEPRSGDPLTNLVKATSTGPMAASNVLRPPASIPASGPLAGPRRVAAVQRALTENGFGQLKPTGAIGPDTQAAIQRFEHDRRMPVTGQISDRLVHELAAVTGHPID